MHKSIYFLLIGVVISLSSCRKDFDTVPSTGSLEFSKQTVYLDTVFTDIGSSTYMLKVYNRSNKDIEIPSIQLAKPDSKYRLMVDGLTGINGEGRVFPSVELLAKDSLFIFIETTANIADANPADFLYTDAIEFHSVNATQKVNLVTLIRDANFIFPNRDLSTGIKEKLIINGEQTQTEGHALITADELHWTNTKPYVVYGYAMVPNGQNLVIDPGTEVHFHDGSGMIVDTGATVNINGGVSTYDGDGNVIINNEVRFEGDRLEPSFEDNPGQWKYLMIASGTNNTINHLTIKNAEIGVYLPVVSTSEQPKVTITNSQIYNSAFLGIYAQAANVKGENLVVNLAGNACLANVSGGTYDFRNCTFNNNWGSPYQVAVSMSNYDTDEHQNHININDLAQANFYNCIIYGVNSVELGLSADATALFYTDFKNCLVKFQEAGTGVEGDPLYRAFREDIVANFNLINQSPKFKNANSNKLNIFADSPAANAGGGFGVLVDVLGVPRTTNDIGAYQNVPVPN